VSSVAKEVGIRPVTIQSWLSRLKAGTLELDGEGTESGASQREASEKLKLLLESKSLSDEQLGEWLRRSGLHSEHLSLWEQELRNIVTDRQQGLRRENSELRKENKKLKRDLERKQAAMAEALALLTLKKKADILLGRDEED